MRNPISVGVVGIGFGQQVHVPAFRSDPRCVVTGLCASRFDSARRVAEELHIPRVYRDAQEMIEDPDLSIIAIATPPGVQVRLGLAAARAGKHLFCEKPLALNAGQANELVTAALANKVVHAIDFEFAEVDAWRAAKHTLQAKPLGRIRQVALAWRMETYSSRARSNSWKSDPAAGGGTLNSLASHTFYYLEWLFGSIGRLAARLSPHDTGTEARVDLWLEFEAGFQGTAAIAADAFLGSGHRLEVYGDEGSLVLENPTADYFRGFVLRLATRTRGTFTEIQTEQDVGNQDSRIAPVCRIVRRFVDAIESGGTVSPDLREGLRVQTLIDAARLSDRSGAWQSVARES